MSNPNKNFYYAVGVGRQVGVYHSWAECEKHVKGVMNAKYKKFLSQQEAVEYVNYWKNKFSPSKGSGPSQMLPVATQGVRKDVNKAFLSSQELFVNQNYKNRSTNSYKRFDIDKYSSSGNPPSRKYLKYDSLSPCFKHNVTWKKDVATTPFQQNPEIQYNIYDSMIPLGLKLLFETSDQDVSKNNKVCFDKENYISFHCNTSQYCSPPGLCQSEYYNSKYLIFKRKTLNSNIFPKSLDVKDNKYTKDSISTQIVDSYAHFKTSTPQNEEIKETTQEDTLFNHNLGIEPNRSDDVSNDCNSINIKNQVDPSFQLMSPSQVSHVCDLCNTPVLVDNNQFLVSSSHSNSTINNLVCIPPNSESEPDRVLKSQEKSTKRTSLSEEEVTSFKCVVSQSRENSRPKRHKKSKEKVKDVEVRQTKIQDISENATSDKYNIELNNVHQPKKIKRKKKPKIHMSDLELVDGQNRVSNDYEGSVISEEVKEVLRTYINNLLKIALSELTHNKITMQISDVVSKAVTEATSSVISKHREVEFSANDKQTNSEQFKLENEKKKICCCKGMKCDNISGGTLNDFVQDNNFDFLTFNLRLDSIEKRFTEYLKQFGTLTCEIKNIKADITKIHDILKEYDQKLEIPPVRNVCHQNLSCQVLHSRSSPREIPSTSNQSLQSAKNSHNKRARDWLDSKEIEVSTQKQRVDTPSVDDVKVEKEESAQEFVRFIIDSDDFVHVYTDGACISNGKFGAKAGIGIWFGENHPLNVSRPVVGPATNNTAEIQAARIAVDLAVKAGVTKLKVNTDSEFLINCITKWIKKWKKNNWTLSSGGQVKNKQELVKLNEAMTNIRVVWNKVPAHQGIRGNEEADRLATEGAKEYIREDF